MSKILTDEYKSRLRRLPEIPRLLPSVLNNKGSDEDVLTVYAVVDLFKPKALIEDRKKLARFVNVLVSRGMYDEARKILRKFDAKDIAKAMIFKVYAPGGAPENLKPLVKELSAVDEEAIEKMSVPTILHGTKDHELLEAARKYATPNNLDVRLRVIGQSFYGSADEEAIKFLITLLKRYRKLAYKILDALVDVRPEPDRDMITKELGETDHRRVVYAGGRSKKILRKIEDILVEGLALGRIGQVLHDYPDLKPVGEYVLEHRLRLRIPEDERRGMFLRALHFFPTLKGYGDKLLYLLSDAIKYAILNEDLHLLRIATSQLADLKVHPVLKAKILREALKGIEESDRFFDALDVILRHLVFDERLAAEIVKVVADTLPDIRAMIAVFGDSLNRLLSSPAAYEVLEALIEAKPGDKALGELLGMVRDERAKIRAAVKLGEEVEDKYKALLYAYDLLEPEKLKEYVKQVTPDDKLLPALKRVIEYLSSDDLDWFKQKISALSPKKAAQLYVLLAARFGDESVLDNLLKATDIEIDYDIAETLASLAARGFRKAEEVLKKFLELDSILAAVARTFYATDKALEFVDELAKRNKEAALALLVNAFRGTNSIEAAEKALELADKDTLKYLAEIAPDSLYVEPLYEKVKEIVEEIFRDNTGHQGA